VRRDCPGKGRVAEGEAFELAIWPCYHDMGTKVPVARDARWIYLRPPMDARRDRPQLTACINSAILIVAKLVNVSDTA